MTALVFSSLGHRGVIAVSGDDRRDFLQGLVSNDVSQVSPDRAVHAALLTPQGRFLFDMAYVFEYGRYLDLQSTAVNDKSHRVFASVIYRHSSH